MKTCKKTIALILSFTLFISYSCSEQDDTDPLDKGISTNKLDASDPVLDYIINLGFSESTIVDDGDRYIVEGDIVFSKDLELPSENENGKTTQYYSGTLINVSRQSNIRVLVDASMNSQSAEVNSAIALWNSSGSNIHFNRVTSGTHDILITNASGGFCGLAGFPWNGNPYDLVEININAVSSHSFAQRTVNIAHELGHCIGMWHTNNSSGSHTEDGHTWNSTAVPGMGGGDSNSIMLGGNCGGLSTQLSNKDKGAVGILYRNPKPTNTQIQITSSQFKVTWQNPIVYGPETHVSNQVSYGGFSGINFGGTVTVSANATSFTVPGVSPNPSSNGTTGGISVTVRAIYSNSTHAGQSASRYKSGGVWQ